jgi:hypothetical protein
MQCLVGNNDKKLVVAQVIMSTDQYDLIEVMDKIMFPRISDGEPYDYDKETSIWYMWILSMKSHRDAYRRRKDFKVITSCESVKRSRRPGVKVDVSETNRLSQRLKVIYMTSLDGQFQ